MGEAGAAGYGGEAGAGARTAGGTRAACGRATIEVLEMVTSISTAPRKQVPGVVVLQADYDGESESELRL